MASQVYHRHAITLTIVVVFGCSFQFGFNIGCLNLINVYIKEMYHQMVEKRADTTNTTADYNSYEYNTIIQVVSSLFIPGGVIGAALGGFLVDRMGRKNTMIFSQIFTAIGVILMAASNAPPSIEMLMIGRFFVGIANGIGNAVAPLFISEVVHTKARGACLTSHQFLVTIGILIGNIVGFRQLLGTQSLWNYVFITLLLSSIVLVTLIPIFPESPSFLVKIRRDETKGRQALEFYRGTKQVDAEFKEILAQRDQEDEEKKRKKFTVGKLFTDKELRKPTLVACFLQVAQQLSGINAIMFYSDSVFRAAGVPAEGIQYSVAGTSLVNVIATIVAIPIMDKAGRRKLLLIPMALMVVVFIIMTIALDYKDDNTAMPYVAIVSVELYVILFAIGLGPIPMMIASEIFRSEPRPYAMMVSGWTNWLFTFIVTMTFEHIMKACKEYTFIIFMGLIIIFFVIALIYVPETKGRDIEDIADEMAGRKGKRKVKKNSVDSEIHEPEHEMGKEDAEEGHEGGEAEGGEAEGAGEGEHD